MLFTWDTTDLCIVFPGWRITGNLSLVASLFAIIALTSCYEFVRDFAHRYEARCADDLKALPSTYLPTTTPLRSLSLSLLFPCAEAV